MVTNLVLNLDHCNFPSHCIAFQKWTTFLGCITEVYLSEKKNKEDSINKEEYLMIILR